MRKFAIGIDPGVNIGFAIYFCKPKQFFRILTFRDTVDFHAYLLAFIRNVLKPKDEVTFYLEATDKIKHVWDAPGRPLPTDPAGVRKLLRVARNVGMNQGQAREIRNILKWHDLKCVDVIPTQKKTTASYFRKISGWTGKLTQHSIDAAMLVIGR